VAYRHDDDHGARIEHERAQTVVVRWLDEQADVGAIEQRAVRLRKPDRPPVERDVGLLQAEDMEQGSPTGVWQARVEKPL
jgi:hypothetical protein